jgi:hypothetical protein
MAEGVQYEDASGIWRGGVRRGQYQKSQACKYCTRHASRRAARHERECREKGQAPTETAHISQPCARYPGQS